jgi:hypothetical protein
VIEDLDAYYDAPNVLYEHPPLILAPSSAKLLYGATLAPLWSGLDGFGRSGLNVIGYSLPPGDPYARQAIYGMVRGYMKNRTSQDPIGSPAPMTVTSLKDSDEGIRLIKGTYRFMPESDTRFYFDGFSQESVEWLFT